MANIVSVCTLLLYSPDLMQLKTEGKNYNSLNKRKKANTN